MTKQFLTDEKQVSDSLNRQTAGNPYSAADPALSAEDNQHWLSFVALLQKRDYTRSSSAFTATDANT